MARHERPRRIRVGHRRRRPHAAISRPPHRRHGRAARTRRAPQRRDRGRRGRGRPLRSRARRDAGRAPLRARSPRVAERAPRHADREAPGDAARPEHHDSRLPRGERSGPRDPPPAAVVSHPTARGRPGRALGAHLYAAIARPLLRGGERDRARFGAPGDRRPRIAPGARRRAYADRRIRHREGARIRQSGTTLESGLVRIGPRRGAGDGAHRVDRALGEARRAVARGGPRGRRRAPRAPAGFRVADDPRGRRGGARPGGRPVHHQSALSACRYRAGAGERLSGLDCHRRLSLVHRLGSRHDDQPRRPHAGDGPALPRPSRSCAPSLAT